MNIKKLKMFARIAQEIATSSTCARVQVGALLVKEGRILASGWNGVSAGAKHCNEIFAGKDFLDPEVSAEHHAFSLKEESHAELNCLLHCARKGIATEGAVLFTTTSPCDQCSKAIVQAGIKEVYYINLYDRDTSGLKYMQNNGVQVTQVQI